ncbi:hypothetical protein MAUB1S_01565 [Mycolicibacterium aubagnense]
MATAMVPILQPVVDAPQRPQVDAVPVQGVQQHRGLGHDAERGADAEYQQLGVAHLDGIDREFARDKHIHAQRDDGHHVVEHRRPGRWPEDVAVVQDCHVDRGQPIEDDLRQKQIREGGGERLIHLRVAAEHQPHQQRCRRDRQHRRHQQQRGGQRDQSPHECGATVGVVAFGPGQHRHEDRGEGGLEHEGGHHVRQLVGDRERTGQCRTENRGEQHDAQEAGDAADQGGEGHAPGPGDDGGVGQFRPAGHRRRNLRPGTAGGAHESSGAWAMAVSRGSGRGGWESSARTGRVWCGRSRSARSG